MMPLERLARSRSLSLSCWSWRSRWSSCRRLLFRRACKLGLEGIVSKRKDSLYRSGRSPDWLKMKNPAAPAVKREAEEDWGR
jgi:hypothetical protein